MDEQKLSKFDFFSPTDYRYSVEELKPYLSEEAFIKYKVKVEETLVKILAKRGLCSHEVADEVINACKGITAQEVYDEERKIKHDIRALVNMIRKRVSDKSKSYIHLVATSYDIVDTANVLRYKDALEKIVLVDMIELEKIWIELAGKEKDTLQIGRTHGQHALPITFGFALAQYIHRWGNRILHLKDAVSNLVGKFSGAVGAYNASSLFFNDPEIFETELLSELGLKPAKISTQVLHPEPMADFIHAIISSFSVLANFADDMRHLQYSEIGEVSESFAVEQVGSSTMPQKRNPINFENVKSMWKVFMPRIITIYLDQISEHQRDLTNSCSSRYIPELLVAFSSSVRRIKKISSKLWVDRNNMQRNFKQNQDKIIAEPLYILLASLGHSNAHEYVRKLVMESLKLNRPLPEIVMEDENLKPYLKKFTRFQKEVIFDPSKYIGIAGRKTEEIIKLWKEKFGTN